MKLYFMKENALAYFKGNIKNNLYHYKDDNADWIKTIYPDNPLQEFKIKVNDFNMNMTKDKPSDIDYYNVKILYDNLKNISDAQATDERLWVGLAHDYLFKYMQYRFNLKNDVFNEDKIKRNFFFTYGKKRSLIHHPIARLWWVGRLTYDKTAQNPYYAIEYLKKDFPTKVLTLFSSNFSNNPKIARVFLDSIRIIEEDGRTVTREQYHELIRYVNILGGTIILDYLPKEYLQRKIINHYYKQNK